MYRIMQRNTRGNQAKSNQEKSNQAKSNGTPIEGINICINTYLYMHALMNSYELYLYILIICEYIRVCIRLFMRMYKCV
jgi:hypothetical protein